MFQRSLPASLESQFVSDPYGSIKPPFTKKFSLLMIQFTVTGLSAQISAKLGGGNLQVIEIIMFYMAILYSDL